MEHLMESTVATRYQGEARLQRLLFLAQQQQQQQQPSSNNNSTSTTAAPADLALAALKLAHDYARQDGNLRRYKEVYRLLQQQQQQTAAAASSNIPPMDTAWITSASTSNRQARQVLYQRLNAAQAHLHKDAIRVAYLALQQHDETVGELQDALHSALRAKDFCTNRPQTATVSVHILQTALQLQNYTVVQDYATKLHHTLGTAASGAASGSGQQQQQQQQQHDATMRYKVLIAAGLERLAARDYTTAAKKLVHACLVANNAAVSAAAASSEQQQAASSPSDTSGGIHWNAVLAPEDVALFAIFLSMSQETARSDALNQITQHPAAFEQLAPAAFEAVCLFSTAGQYKQAWTCLEQAGCLQQLETDLYMALHWQDLVQALRRTAMQSYWRAYQRVDFATLQQHLGPGLLPLVDDDDSQQEWLHELIHTGALPADTRLDLTSLVRMTTASHADQHLLEKTQFRLNQTMARTVDDTYSMVVRLACVQHDLIVSDPSSAARKRRGGGGGRGGRAGDGAFAAFVHMDDDDDDDDSDNHPHVLDVAAGNDGDDDDIMMLEQDADMMDVVAGGVAGDQDAMNPEDLY